MKKILTILLVLCMAFSVVSVQADAISDLTLGSPLLNVDDTAFVTRYPAALQKFPNSIYAVFDYSYTYAWNYALFGVAYKLSDMAALKVTYDTRGTGTSQTFYNNAGGILATWNLDQVASVTYGLKMGGLMAGLAAKTYFFDGATIKTTSINTNAEEYAWAGVSGFITTFDPSVALEVAGLNVYAKVNSQLNFTKRYAITTNADKYNTYQKPALLKDLGVSLLATLPMGDKTLVGAELGFSMHNEGYESQQVQASTNVYKTNAWVGGNNRISVGVGTRVKASESATFFVDVEASLQNTTAVHKKDWDGNTFNVTTTWNLPSVNLGAEMEIIKNLKFRISANPSYSISTTKRKSYDNASANATFNTTVSGFGLGSSLGLGYKIGSFVINWELDGNLVDELLNNPLTFIEINGYNNGNWLIGQQVQVSYRF